MDGKNPSLTDIKLRRQEIAEQTALLAAEDKALAMAEDVLEGLLARGWSKAPVEGQVLLDPFVPGNSASAGIGEPSFSRKHSPRRKTKKGMILDALQTPRPLWQTARDIRDHMAVTSGTDVKMSSISPALTDLKGEDLIVRKNLSVALRQRALKEEPGFFNENGEAEASPEAEDDNIFN